MYLFFSLSPYYGLAITQYTFHEHNKQARNVELIVFSFLQFPFPHQFSHKTVSLAQKPPFSNLRAAKTLPNILTSCHCHRTILDRCPCTCVRAISCTRSRPPPTNQCTENLVYTYLDARMFIGPQSFIMHLCSYSSSLSNQSGVTLLDTERT